ncbi:MAG TPA: glycosyltransferase, partial [Pyrinomonadaceae bacterium]|nr:glycosyltransferase [Pyrinomonadaceae bacterium]
SERDRAQLRAAEPGARVFVVENGVDTAFYSDEQLARAHRAWLEGGRAAGAKPAGSGEVARSPDARRERVLFVGSMDYHANVEAVLYFGKEIWPRVREREPRLVFTVVGRTPPPEIRRLAELPGVEVTGTVEDVRPYYAEALAAVIPLRVGGGSRLKILEAMAAGVPVVSTTLGAEGIEVRDGENIILADDAEATRDALSSLNEDEGLHQRLASGGRALVFAQYDWSSLGARLGKVYGEILAGRRER